MVRSRFMGAKIPFQNDKIVNVLASSYFKWKHPVLGLISQVVYPMCTEYAQLAVCI